MIVYSISVIIKTIIAIPLITFITIVIKTSILLWIWLFCSWFGCFLISSLFITWSTTPIIRITIKIKCFISFLFLILLWVFIFWIFRFCILFFIFFILLFRWSRFDSFSFLWSLISTHHDFFFFNHFGLIFHYSTIFNFFSWCCF